MSATTPRPWPTSMRCSATHRTARLRTCTAGSTTPSGSCTGRPRRSTSTSPTAVVLPTTLNLLTDEAAEALIDALRDALVAGSYVLMAHTSLDIPTPGTAEIIAVLNSVLEEPYISRTEREILHYLEGFDLLDPGLVPIERWRPDGDAPFLPGGQLISLFGAVGRKP